jgi:hypothetical protein
MINHKSQSFRFADICSWHEVATSATLQCGITITTPENGAGAVLRESNLLPNFGAAMSQTFHRLVEGQDIVDTKFVLFSQRHRQTRTDGQIVIGAKAPREVYANSAILSSVSEYFQSCTQYYVPAKSFASLTMF